MGPWAFHLEAILCNDVDYLMGTAEDGFNRWSDWGAGQALWDLTLGGTNREQMLRFVCALMGSISPLSFPSLDQIQDVKDSVGGHGEEQGSPWSMCHTITKSWTKNEKF